MKRRRHPLFPDGLSDESAAAISEFLHQLAAACEARYLAHYAATAAVR